MKKFWLIGIIVLIFLLLLGSFMVSYHKTAVKKAYDNGVFFGYAEGYLKHKYYSQYDECFVYDENLSDYVSLQTKVYTTKDKIYHRKECPTADKTAKIITEIFREYSPYTLCKPPIVLQ